MRRRCGCFGPTSYGKEHDELTSLSYYGFRFYDRLTLTWTQADPLYRFVPDLAWNEPRRANLYSFSVNNPLRYVDPDGRNPIIDEDYNNPRASKVTTREDGGLLVLEAGDDRTDSENIVDWGNPAGANYFNTLSPEAQQARIEWVESNRDGLWAAILGAMAGGVGGGDRTDRAQGGAKPVAAGTVGGKSLAKLRVGSHGELKGQVKDSHHVIQDAAVRDLPGYSTRKAPAVELPGPSTKIGTPHYRATQVQRQPGGGTYAAERRIGYKALRTAGIPEPQARALVQMADEYFGSIGVLPTTATRLPGNR